MRADDGGRTVRDDGMTAVLVVCTANVCRSPMAEALLAREAGRRPGAVGATVTSAGTDAPVGAPAASGAVAAMARAGLDLSEHRARAVQDDDVDAADLVLTMEGGHVAALVAGRPDRFAHVLSIGEFVQLVELHGDRDGRPMGRWLDELGADRSATEVLTRTDLDVTDPIGGPRRGFRRCAARLAEDCERVATALWGPALDGA